MKRLSGGRFARLAFAAAVVMAGLALSPVRADVVVQIDKSSQRMAVSVDGMTRYNWPVSTGRSGYGTPSGVFHPQLMARRWFSRKYYNSPMPHAIFFYGGFAIHGTYELSRLGGPASHGCVRLHPAHAAALFALVERDGPRHTRIEISN
jgi:lipoprotein-anchoring transpeptidase ErfK/SrfK